MHFIGSDWPTPLWPGEYEALIFESEPYVQPSSLRIESNPDIYKLRIKEGFPPKKEMNIPLYERKEEFGQQKTDAYNA